MRTLTRALTLTSIATAVRSGFRGPLDGLSAATKAALVHLGGGRRLLTTYPANSPIVRVRRSTDNAEADIGALRNGAIDAASAATFAGAGDLFVVSSYDQSGAGRNLSQATPASQPWLVITGGRASMLFDGSSDFFQRPTLDFPGNMALLPATGPNFVTGDSATFDNGFGGWRVVGSQGALTANGGVGQITGVNNYGSKAFINLRNLAGKNVLFELDVWTSGGPAYIQVQRADTPFDEFASTYVGDPTPRRVQLYLQSGSWTSVNLAIAPWAGSSSQVVYFDNISVRELDPNADTGVTVAMRIKPESNAASSIWSMRSVFTGYLDFGRNADGTLRLGYSSNAGVTASGSTATPVALGESAVVVARWDFVTRSGSIRINGVEQTVLSSLEITSGLNPIPYLVGATNTGSVTNFFGGLISEPIVFKSHVSDAECQIIEAALGATP